MFNYLLVLFFKRYVLKTPKEKMPKTMPIKIDAEGKNVEGKNIEMKKRRMKKMSN